MEKEFEVEMSFVSKNDANCIYVDINGRPIVDKIREEAEYINKMIEQGKKYKQSFIEDHEEAEAEAFVEKHLGFKPPRPVLNHMFVKISVREEDVTDAVDKDGNPLVGESGNLVKIAIPKKSLDRDKFRNCTALVVSQGPTCYTDEKFKHSGKSCKVGDWILFPRNMGRQICYRGIPMQVILDEHVFGVVKDPSYVTLD